MEEDGTVDNSGWPGRGNKGWCISLPRIPHGLVIIGRLVMVIRHMCHDCEMVRLL